MIRLWARRPSKAGCICERWMIPRVALIGLGWSRPEPKLNADFADPVLLACSAVFFVLELCIGKLDRGSIDEIHENYLVDLFGVGLRRERAERSRATVLDRLNWACGISLDLVEEKAETLERWTVLGE